MESRVPDALTPYDDIDRAPVLGRVRVYRLAEWPAYYPTTDGYRLEIEQRCRELARVGRTFVGVPAISIVGVAEYAAAVLLTARSDALFGALPAAARTQFGNSTATFLAALRRREVRDALAANNLMLFEGEGHERVVGRRPDLDAQFQLEDPRRGKGRA